MIYGEMRDQAIRYYVALVVGLLFTTAQNQVPLNAGHLCLGDKTGEVEGNQK